MVNRKVIQLAKNTLVVSLPSSWVKKTSISKGDSVAIDEVGAMLMISSGGLTVSRQFTIDVSTLGFSKNMLSYLYQKGYDEIEIVNLNDAVLRKVRERVSDLMGFEIIEHSEKRCVIKSVSKELDSEFDNMLRRTFLITREMAGNLLAALDCGDYDRMAEIRSLEKTTNTFTDFCKRVLSKGSYSDPENTVYMYIIVRDLEKVADSYKRICDVFIDKKGKPIRVSKKVIALMKDSAEFFNTFYKLFYKFNQCDFEKFRSEGKVVLKSANALLVTGSGAESLVINNLISVVTDTYDMSGPHFILNIGKMFPNQR